MLSAETGRTRYLRMIRVGWRTSRAFGPAVALVLAFCMSAGAGAPSLLGTGDRSLSFVHTHTHEELSVVYYRDGMYDHDEIVRLRRFLRDFRDRREHDIDPALLDLLFEIRQATGSRKPFQVISCYRSPNTNEMLRRTGGGVAKDSFHMRGRAIDVRLADVPTTALRQIALELGRGGVGYYEASDFVHVDTGPVRQWVFPPDRFESADAGPGSELP